MHFWVLNIYAEGHQVRRFAGCARLRPHCGHQPFDLHNQPHCADRCHREPAAPLAKLHFPVHELAMMMTIALRFIPTLIEETEKIIERPKARGAMLDNGTFTQRIKALVPIPIPLFISAFRRADELAMAMECRCYHGGEGRTRLKQLKFTSEDFRCMVVISVALVVTLFYVYPSPATTAGAYGMRPYDFR